MGVTGTSSAPSFELFLLGDGEKKITEKTFAGMSNTSDFTILKEDHTLGNLLAETLKQAPHVMMAAYKIGHPNVPEMLLRVQTDGTLTPREALVKTCKQLIAAYGQLGREFQKELALRQYADQGEHANNAAGGPGGGAPGGGLGGGPGGASGGAGGGAGGHFTGTYQ